MKFDFILKGKVSIKGRDREEITKEQGEEIFAAYAAELSSQEGVEEFDIFHPTTGKHIGFVGFCDLECTEFKENE